MITVHVPAMTARHDVRAISASISDVPGVQTLQADLVTRTVQVTGSADRAAITAAVTAAGYSVARPPTAPRLPAPPEPEDVP
jgi:copper chaperone CopZ